VFTEVGSLVYNNHLRIDVSLLCFQWSRHWRVGCSGQLKKWRYWTPASVCCNTGLLLDCAYTV